MGTFVQYVLCLINLLLVGAIPNNLFSNAVFGVENIRLRRQAGISAQQMYYAYPAPTSGNTGNVGYSNTDSTGATSTENSGAAGYNYGSATQNTETGSTGGTDDSNINSGYTSSGTTMTSGGSSGYSYSGGTQNTLSISHGGSTSLSSGSRGYDYKNTNLQTVPNSGSTGYSSSSSGSSSVISTGVSTKAPEYLPPTNSGGGNIGLSVPSNIQTGTASVMPSDIYLPPTVSMPQLTPSVTVEQTGGNAAQVSGPTKTYIPPLNTPSSTYLKPSSGQQTSNVQNTQSQVTVTSTGNVQSIPTQEYLPPVITSSGKSGSVFTPAAKYLPPVF
ncbi:uncharacterized transmembrane protein DDB_G0289901-like isoform X2 [Vanessa cardui]|uniref:uncharacterized transmembrane protein DDB_G0289901-like isoform X2 n=1 Tax=Vanessa cardui TaxID=171605 RepID=UPI001F137D0B|nr:uncharacterized transmembrane protein DDB_G0289901-like isoform X2 [Vanessa cardui]